MSEENSSEKLCIILFSGDLDKAIAAFIIANGALAMDMEVSMFFPFWGINVLRKERPPRVVKDFISRMFGWMMPRGASRLKLSKMNIPPGFDPHRSGKRRAADRLRHVDGCDGHQDGGVDRGG